MRRGIKGGPRKLAAAIAGGVIFAFAVASIDYVRGGAEDPWGVLGWLFPSPSAYPDMPLDRIEARLGALIADQSFRAEPGPARRFEIDGCLATFTTRDHGRQICEEDASYWRTQEICDLRLLVTDPRKVEISPSLLPRFAGAAAVKIPVHAEAAGRLESMYRQFRQRVKQEIRRDSARGVRDLSARMDRLRAFTREQLSDRLFERKATRTFYCEAGVLLAPGDPDEARLTVGEDDAPEVVELLHAYAVRACPFDEAALAPE